MRSLEPARLRGGATLERPNHDFGVSSVLGKVPGIASEISSESEFLEKCPTPFILEVESGKWMSSTPVGKPGKGELYFSASDDGSLTKHMESVDAKDADLYCGAFIELSK